MTSSAHRDYVLTSGSTNQTLSYHLHQNITVTGCPHARSRLPTVQQLSVARAFALYDGHEQVLRYALTSRISSTHGEHGRYLCQVEISLSQGFFPCSRCFLPLR